MPTDRKIALVAELRDLIASAEIAIATAYQGIGVGEQTRLRQQLTDAGVEFRVVKNTLLIRAAEESGVDAFKALADGPTALVVGTEEPVTAARAIVTYIREHAGTPVAVRNAVVGGKLVDAAYVADLATVPPRDELIARIAGGLIGKVVELVGLLQATTREFAQLIEARAQQLDGAQPASD